MEHRSHEIYVQGINRIHENKTQEILTYLLTNTLHNVYVVEELIQLTIESNAEIIVNSHWTEDPTWDFYLLGL